MLLRPLQSGDLIPYHQFLSDPEVNVWLEDACQRPLILSEVENALFHQLWTTWAIEQDDELIGVSGFSKYDAARSVARFFIVIGKKELWGQGIGGAAMKEVLRRGFEDLGLRKIESDYLQPNLASEKLHKRHGFTVEGCLRQDAWRRGEWVDRVLLSLLRDEYFSIVQLSK